MELCARQVLGDGTALSERLLHPQVGGRYGDHIKTRDRRRALLGMSLGGSCEERTLVLAQGAHSVPVCPDVSHLRSNISCANLTIDGSEYGDSHCLPSESLGLSFHSSSRWGRGLSAGGWANAPQLHFTLHAYWAQGGRRRVASFWPKQEEML